MNGSVSDSGLVVISGGIGSGKSVVRRILESLGCHVYDCDSRAKALMDNSDDIKRRIAAEIAVDCIADGAIDRPRLAQCVFADAGKLAALNEITHGAVRADIRRWAESLAAERKPLFVETAIPSESAIDKMADALWLVEAPIEIRIKRVMARNNMSRQQVEARIASQACEARFPGIATEIIDNDGIAPILPRILNLLESYSL